MYLQAFFNQQYASFVLPEHFVEVLRRWKKFFGCLILPWIVGQMRHSLCLKLTIFTIKTEWDAAPNLCVTYFNSMIYLPAQFYALCPVLSRVILSFSTKCPIMPHATPLLIKKIKIERLKVFQRLERICSGRLQKQLKPDLKRARS